MGMIEILINGDKFEIIDWGDLNYPQSDFTHYGFLNLGGQPSNYLVSVFDRF